MILTIVMLVGASLFVLFGAFCLLRPAAVIRYPLRNHVGEPAPDTWLVRLIARMPGRLRTENETGLADTRDQLFRDPQSVPGAIRSYRLIGAIFVFVGAMILIDRIRALIGM